MNNNDYNNHPYIPQDHNYSDSGRQYIYNPGQTMAAISMILGIVSFITVFSVYIPLICGSIAIILALLSKGYGKKLLTTAKIGVGTAIGGFALVITVFGSLMTLFFSSSGDTLVQFGQEMDKQFEQQTGRDLKDVLGSSYEDIMKEYAEMLGK